MMTVAYSQCTEMILRVNKGIFYKHYYCANFFNPIVLEHPTIHTVTSIENFYSETRHCRV